MHCFLSLETLKVAIVMNSKINTINKGLPARPATLTWRGGGRQRRCDNQQLYLGRDQRLLKAKSSFCVQTLPGRWTRALTALGRRAGREFSGGAATWVRRTRNSLPPEFHHPQSTGV